MPVSIDRFESDEHLSEPSIGERVIAHLASNNDKAFTRSEIADAIDANTNAVGSALTRLKDRELVRHRQQYWAITDDIERLRAANDLHLMLEELAATEDEAFDREAWLATADPIEEHREESEEPDRDG